MQIFTVKEGISSARSLSSPITTSTVQDEPRKKGARGKRSVTHLSKAQLTRKRANDREAQRNIRQRTKEHIEKLERKVRELEESSSRAGSWEWVLARNRELEEEIEDLRARFGVRSTASVSIALSSQGIPEELLMPQKVEVDWMLDADSMWPQRPLPSHISSPPAEAPASSGLTSDISLYPTAPAMNTNGYGSDDAETGQQLYTPSTKALPIWDDAIVFSTHSTQAQPQSQSPSLSKQAPTPIPTPWPPFQPTSTFPHSQQSSRLTNLQPQQYPFSNSSSHTNAKTTTTTSSWQSQTSINALAHSQAQAPPWQLSTKLKAPMTHVNHLNHLMLSVVHSQQHLAMSQ